MNTSSANAAKASFNAIYSQDTPHEYFAQLGSLDYSICDETRPFSAAAVNLLRQWDSRVRMLDIGCSYGINAAVIKYGISFAELARFFDSNVPVDLDAACRKVRESLAKAPVTLDLECGGLDVSASAVHFARGARMLDHGIVADLEQGTGALLPEDQAWIRDVNLIVATGAIGYVTDKTVGAVLASMGEQAPNSIVLLTILRVFDSSALSAVLRQHGLESRFIEGALLPQRRFHGEDEQGRIIRVLSERGLVSKPEAGGRHYARLLLATRPDRLSGAARVLEEVARGRLTLGSAPNPGSRTEAEDSIHGGTL